jgi:HEAT repeat protein
MEGSAFKWIALGLAVVLAALVCFAFYQPPTGPHVLSADEQSALNNPGQRAAKARELGRLKSKDAVPLLIGFCNDQDAEMRLACVQALAEIGHPDGVQALRIRVFDADVRVREAAAVGLGLLYDETACNGLVDALKDKDSRVRLAAIRSLAPYADAEAIAGLTDVLRDPDSDRNVRLAAVEALAGQPEQAAAGGLRRALSDADAAVRLAAVKGLASRADPTAYSALAQAMTDADPSVRAAAGAIARKIGKPLLQYMEKTLSNASQIGARLEAAQLLKALGPAPETVPPLLALLENIPSRSRETPEKLVSAVVEALAALGEGALGPLDAKVFSGECGRLAEQAAAQACKRIGRAAAKPIAESILHWKLYHDPEELRLWVQVLGELGDPCAASALNRALSQDIEGMAELVAQARARIEAASGVKLPPAAPDPVAFHQPVEKVGSLDIAPGLLPPTTKPISRIPHEGSVKLFLQSAVIRPFGSDNSRAELSLDLLRRGGDWEEYFWGYGLYFNKSQYPGRIVKRQADGDKVVLNLEVVVRDDAWVKGGFGEYEVELRPGPKGLTGAYRGRYNLKEVSGAVAVHCGEGKLPPPDLLQVDSGEHPRLLLRKADLPVLRARAQTDLGRRIVRSLLAKVAAGKVEDFAGYVNSVSTWVPGMERAIAQAFLAMLFDDPLHGRRAAQTAYVRAVTQAYGGEHGERLPYPLMLLGLGFDMTYDFCQPEQRRRLEQEVRTFYGFISALHGLQGNMAGGAPPGAYSCPAMNVLAMLREKSPFDLPILPDPLPVLLMGPDKSLGPREGVPVNELTPGVMVRGWLMNGPFEPEDGSDLLASLGGAAAAQPQEGAGVAYRGTTFRFRPLAPEAVRPTPGVGHRDECLRLPGATSETRSFLYALLKVNETTGVQMDCSHPFGYRASKLWVNGQLVFNRTVLLLEPGLYRLMLEVQGAVVSPYFIGVNAPQLRAKEKELRWLMSQWAEARKAHDLNGETQQMPVLLGWIKRGLRTVLWYEIDSLRKTNRAVGGDILWAAASAYQRVTGEPLPRDTPLPATDNPALVRGRLGDGYLCHTMHLAPPELKPALVWEFNRRFPAGNFGRLSCQELVAAFVNYPLTVAPQHPDQTLAKTSADAQRGVYLFQNGLSGPGAFTLQVFSRPEKPVETVTVLPRAGSFRLAGFGTEWAADGAGRGLRGGRGWASQRFENLLEVDPSGAEGVGKVMYYASKPDGSGVLGLDMSGVYSEGPELSIQAERHLAADYSGRSGAPALYAVVDHIKGGSTKTWTLFTLAERIAPEGRSFTIHARGSGGRGPGRCLRGWFVSPADVHLTVEEAASGRGRFPLLKARSERRDAFYFVVFTVQDGAPPQLTVRGEGAEATAVVGEQEIRFDGRKLVLK